MRSFKTMRIRKYVHSIGMLLFFMITVARGGSNDGEDRNNTGTLTWPELGYVPVPSYVLPDGVAVAGFFVMKYEAKQSTTFFGTRDIRSATNPRAAVPISKAAGTPWVSLTWEDARRACNAAGARLISENQWLSIAHQAVSVDGNWSGGAVGIGFLFSGHSDSSPDSALTASGTDGNGYASTENNDGSQRRTLGLPNGSVIWDLAGNVWEWVDEAIPAKSRYLGASGQWLSYGSGPLNVANNFPEAKRPPSTYSAIHGLGKYCPGTSLGGGITLSMSSQMNASDTAHQLPFSYGVVDGAVERTRGYSRLVLTRGVRMQVQTSGLDVPADRYPVLF